MIRSLRDILVVSDMDGTLLADDKKLHAANLETIRLFTSLGGRFTVATGRTTESVLQVEELVPYLSPAITCGGCTVHDFAANKLLKCETVPPAVARAALQQMAERFPALGTAVVGGDQLYYAVRPTQQVHQLFFEENIGYRLRPNADLPGEWIKVLFAGEPAYIDQVKEATANAALPGAHFVANTPTYYELLPDGANKGEALLALCEHLEVPVENTVVIGDYYNDVDMMKLAGHSVAVGNAPRDIQMLADETTGTNNAGGVGQYLFSLIRKYGEGAAQ